MLSWNVLWSTALSDDLGAGLLGVGLGHRREPVVGGADALGLVDAELHGRALTTGRSGVVTAARGEQVGAADGEAAQGQTAQHGAPRGGHGGERRPGDGAGTGQ